MRVYLTSVFNFLFLSIIFLTACESPQTPRDLLYTEVMEIHDDVMPEMSTIHRLKKQLKAIDTTVVKTPDYPTILKYLGDLEKADEGMMSWMAEFSNPSPETSEAEALLYLKKEKKNISTVRDQMRKSIDSAKKVLSEIKTKFPENTNTQ